MKRGIGIKYQANKLTSERLTEWLFDNIGDPQTRTSDGSLVAADQEDGVYVTHNAQSHILRIALWTNLQEEPAWEQINQWAKRIARDCQCDLTTWAIDRYEYDDTQHGYVCRYDSLVPGEILEKAICGPSIKITPKIH